MAKQPLSDYEIAQKRVKKQKEFYQNFISWVIFSAAFLAFNLWTSPEFLWSLFAIGGWGIGVLFHGLEAFGIFGKHTKWEEAAIEREMERMANRRGHRPQHNLPPADRVEEEALKLKTLRKDYDETDFV